MKAYNKTDWKRMGALESKSHKTTNSENIAPNYVTTEQQARRKARRNFASEIKTHNDMKDVRLNNDVMMPAIGFGVFQIPVDETERIVSDAIEVGYRMWSGCPSLAEPAQCGGYPQDGTQGTDD